MDSFNGSGFGSSCFDLWLISYLHILVDVSNSELSRGAENSFRGLVCLSKSLKTRVKINGLEMNQTEKKCIEIITLII